MAYPKVTIVGAGQVGATAALLLLLAEAADVVLVDVAEGLPQGKALDMMHSRSVLGFGPRVAGTNDYADTAGSDIVVITAGLPRKPGMTRDDLLAANADIVRSVVRSATQASPDAILLCVTNPLDVMTYLAWRESGAEPSRVFGMGGVLDSARFAYAISETAGAPIEAVEAVVMGAHGDKMVPVPSLSTVNGVPVAEAMSAEDADAVVERTVFGGAEVVSLLKTGSAFYAPGASVAAMVRAILSDSRETMPSCVLLSGEYGISDLYMSVPAVVGREGVLDVPEVVLTEDEAARLAASAASIAESLDALGLRT
jgi:malate dehydrogenase